jgi:hypothetical protein
MNSRLLVVSLSALTVALSACQRAPREQLVLEPTTRQPCWFSARVPEGTRVIVDVPLDVAEYSKRTPSEADAAIVRALGGRLMHVFNVPMLRVEIDTSAIPELLYRLDARILLPVADTSRFDVTTVIFFSGPIRPEDTARVAALGARFSKPLLRGMMGAVVADSIIPAIRKVPYVTWVKGPTGACMGFHRPLPAESLRMKPPPASSGPVRMAREVATHPWVGEDYAPWIAQMESTHRIQVSAAAPYDSVSRAFRLAVIRLPRRTTLIIEEVRYGAGGCCARVASVREVELQSLFRGYEGRNAFEELRLVGAPPHTNFRIGLEQIVFEIVDITEERLRFVLISR